MRKFKYSKCIHPLFNIVALAFLIFLVTGAVFVIKYAVYSDVPWPMILANDILLICGVTALLSQDLNGFYLCLGFQSLQTWFENKEKVR
jgi:hypothetical protein